ncbi:alpha/beta fold hydrolase [Pseudolysinimonas sp.]|uniref:alpha/beta fold hydrolase n=1 Tax=Pseudolysinimonas sp. TaxID=2680009 RepID=UPI003F813129
MPSTRTFATARHTTRYLEAGPSTGPLMLFLHGWPGIGLMWRAQLDALAADGWHCVAPDLRGYGGSSAPMAAEAYRIEEIVRDMTELHDHLGGGTAVWVGHDWGSIVVGALAAHEPGRLRGAALVSWAHFPESNAFYTTHFDQAVADLDADISSSFASVFRAGDPASVGTVSPSAVVTRRGGRFGDAHRAPEIRPDPAIWPADDFDALVEAFSERGFRGPCSWYLNDEANAAYAATAPDGGRLSIPVLFVNGAWDLICSIDGNAQGDPMRRSCSDLTVADLPGGHWLPLERSVELVSVLRGWIRAV